MTSTRCKFQVWAKERAVCTNEEAQLILRGIQTCPLIYRRLHGLCRYAELEEVE